eukprot:m.34193 g.34193  ORF g.34193 m.34193 type:complete len:376 (-) comp8688_c0_seq1:1781-2908(-)
MNWIFVVLQTLPVAVYGNTPPLQAACNYNGYTMANNNVTCQCEKPWQGATCDILNLKPVSRALGLGYQYQINGQNVTSWGGSVVRGDDGVYHMYAAEIYGFCGMNVWLANSIVVHASSPDPATQPFTRHNQVHGVFSHEPAGARAPTGEYVVFFTAAAPPYRIPVYGQKMCTGCSNGISPAKCGTDSTDRNASIFLPTFMVHSVNPDGPWTEPVMVTGTNVFADSNFAHVINEDGSLLALMRRQIMYSPDWRNMSAYKIVGTWQDFGEDPFLWRDKRNGVYHALVHRNRINTTGLHYYSEDGVKWTPSPGGSPAYTSVVQYDDGSQHNFGCRERPHLIFNENGTIMALTNGAAPIHCHVAGSNDHAFTLLQLTNS